MFNLNKMKNRSAVLFLVLVVLLIVVILANIMLGIVSSQSRLTHHQVSRIQAYYASMGGMNYALDMLRRGIWVTPSASFPYYTKTICRSAGCDVLEGELPKSIHNVTIEVAYRGNNPSAQSNNCKNCNPPSGVNTCICIVSDYTN